MKDDQGRLMDLFHEARAKGSAEERDAYLTVACGGDDALRQQVEALLQAHTQLGDFLEPPSDHPPLSECPGAVIGHYKLLEEIGEGAFGRVFMAAQIEPVRRKVALKVVKAGMDTREVVARFEAERQALALMDHPNIAKVFDAGTTGSGRPYFVMELVRGVPITRYCDERNLPMAARLGLFTEICHAVQHAHQKAVIHRDLKPTNILVTELDGEAVPKVIDFGVAKALGQQLTEKTLYTAFQQVIGTPAYMSPEQTALSGTDIDTRSDIYSLGVLLYELLTGVTPIDTETLRQAGLDEIRRMIRETEPPKPSTRLRSLGVELAVVAHHRHLEPSTLTRLVHGDLDWIVMKALEKDRARRYETANALIEDVRRHLEHEPVRAGPPGVLYRTRKFVRRHRTGVVLGASVAAAVIAGLVVSLLGFAKARQERDRALQAESLAEQNRQRAEEARGHAAERATIAHNRLTIIEARRLAKTRPHEALLMLREIPANAAPETAAHALAASHEELRSARFVTERRLFGHTGALWDVAWSPDGRQILTASADRTVRVWNADSSEEAIVLAGHTMGVVHAAWSPDGKRIVSASLDSTARVWEVGGTGEPVILAGHTKAVFHAAWSPDGKRIVTASEDTTARVWNADGSGEPIVLSGHSARLRCAAWSSDGRQILTAAGDETVRVCNADGSGEPIVLAGRVNHAAWSPDGTRIVTTAPSGPAQVWNADGSGEPIVLAGGKGSSAWAALMGAAAWSPDGKRIVMSVSGQVGAAQVLNADGTGKPLILAGHTEWLAHAAWSPDGKRIVTASLDRTVRVWNADDGSHDILTGHTSAVHQAAWSPDGKRIVTRATDGTARVWRLDDTGGPIRLAGHRDILRWAAWSPDGKRIVTASKDGTARVWDADGSNAAIELDSGNESGFREALWSPDGKRIVTLSRDRYRARLWNADGEGEPVVLAEMVGGAAWSPDGKRIAMSIEPDPTDPDRAVRVWNADGSVTPISLPHPRAVLSIGWSPNGKRIATACFDGTARVWNADGTGDPTLLVGRLVGHHGGGSATWSPDGKRIVIASMEQTALVWNADGTGTPIILAGHQAVVRHAVWSPDGKRIVTASVDKTARVWNADGSGTPVVLTGHTEPVDRAAWTPDGNSIVTASKDGTIRLWSADGNGEELVFSTYLNAGATSVYLALSPDGKRIVTASRDGTAWVWTIRDWPETRALLWEHLPDILTPEERTLYLGETPEETDAAVAK